MKRWIAFCSTFCIAACISAAETQPATAPAATAEDVPTSLTAQVKIETSMGGIVLELDAERAPISVLNFLEYVDAGHYEGTIFHRIIPTFMIQGGNFTADYEQKETRDPIKNEWRNGLKNVRGTIAMARQTPPDTATDQFFINVVDNAFLDMPNPQTGNAGYAVFGKVVEGMDVVDAIKDVPTHPEPRVGGAPAPNEPVVIEKASILADIDREAARRQIGAAEAMAAQEAQRQAEVASQQVEALKAQFREDAGGKVVESESGLLFYPVEEGEGVSPQMADSIAINFTMALPDGTVVASTEVRGEPMVAEVGSIRFEGLREGVRMMKPGGRAKLIVPPQLGAGERGAGVIPPNSHVIIDVELAEVNPAQE